MRVQPLGLTPSSAPPLLAAGLWQLAAAVDVIDFEELSFGKLLGAGAMAGASVLGVLEFIIARCMSWSCCLDGVCRGVEVDGCEGVGVGTAKPEACTCHAAAPDPVDRPAGNPLRLFGAPKPTDAPQSPWLCPRGPACRRGRGGVCCLVPRVAGGRQEVQPGELQLAARVAASTSDSLAVQASSGAEPPVAAKTFTRRRCPCVCWIHRKPATHLLVRLTRVHSLFCEQVEDSLHEVQMYLLLGSHDNIVALR